MKPNPLIDAAIQYALCGPEWPLLEKAARQFSALCPLDLNSPTYQHRASRVLAEEVIHLRGLLHEYENKLIAAKAQAQATERQGEAREHL